jgi:hypothetical protein
MTTKNAKKTSNKTLAKTSNKAAKTSNKAAKTAPTLAELVNGTSPIVAMAVAEKKAKTMAEKPAAPGKKSNAKKSNAKADKKTSGALIKQMILEGADAETILATIHKEFPGSKATKGDVSWNRWDLKRKGLLKAD